MSKGKIILFLIISLSLFLRVNRLSELMSFGGDVARDYLVARDITLKGQIPLLGCPSSVPWLHQGAFFTYLLGIVLWLGRYNPLAGGYFVGGLGVLGVLGVYLLGKKLFSAKVGLLAAFFYATSPLIIIFDRFPYHLSLVSFFTILFFLFLYFSFTNPKAFLIASLLLGLLMQLELSNLVLLPVWVIILLELRQKINIKILILSLLAFLIPWTPKIVYDINNGFTQTIGFIAWIFHKLPPVSFFMVKEAGMPLLTRFEMIFVYLSRVIFWKSVWLSTIIFIFCLLAAIWKFKFNNRMKNKGLYLILLWLFFPLVGFLVHGSPSESYIPILFTPVALLLSLITNFGFVPPRRRLGGTIMILIVGIGVFNAYFVVSHDFFLLTERHDDEVEKYNLGQSLALNKEIADFIVNDSQGREYNLIPLGKMAEFSSSKLNLTYLTWYLGRRESEDKENLIYFVYNNYEQINIQKKSLIKKFPYMTIIRREKTVE